MRGTFRASVVIPAAGHSRRMGQAKLCLPLGGRTVIEQTLAAFNDRRIEANVVVVRGDDDALCAVLRASSAHVVRADPHPSDMRESVEVGLSHVASQFRPSNDDVWVLCPADCVFASTRLVAELFDRWENEDADILVPVFDGKRGHPALFRWSLVPAIRDLPANVGLNRLRSLPDVRVVEHVVTTDCVLADLDTPAEYTAIRNQWDKETRDDMDSGDGSRRD